MTDSEPQNAPLTEKLTPKQLEAVVLLLGGNTNTAVAEAVGINRKTLYKWRALPEFREALAKGAEAIFEDGLAILKSTFEESARTYAEYINRTATISRDRALVALRGLREISRSREIDERIRENRELTDAILRREHNPEYGENGNGHNGDRFVPFWMRED